MKNLIVIAILLTSLATLEGCGAARPMRQIDLPAQALGAPTSDASQHRVVFFNNSNFLKYGMDGSGKINIYLNEKALGQLKIGQYVVVEMPPGEHRVDLLHKDIGNFSSIHTLQVKHNEQYVKIYAKLTSNGLEVVPKPDNFENRYKQAYVSD
jgi:predicted small lipoprotein YifL